MLVRFITQVASRFGVVVTQKVAAQALPVVGALGGAAVNYAFIEHFQEVARGQFTVRRLERVYGKALCERNMSALLRATESQLSPYRSGLSLLLLSRAGHPIKYINLRNRVRHGMAQP